MDILCLCFWWVIWSLRRGFLFGQVKAISLFVFLLICINIRRLVKLLGLPSRLWLLSACTLLAAPLAVATLYFPPPGAFGCLIVYYFFAETWFAVLFTVIVEIVDPEVSQCPLVTDSNIAGLSFHQVRSTCIAIFLFLMNLVGGNLPVIVSPLRSYFNDYR